MLPRVPVVGLAQSFARRGARGWGWYYKALEEQSAAKVTPLAETLLNEPPAAAQRPRVFLSVRYDEGKTARLEFELASEIVPRTCENFVKLCTGDAGYHLKGTKLQRIYKDQVIVGGDFGDGDSRGGHSALGSRTFADENFVLRHTGAGVLSMANSGTNTNSSIFFVTARAMPHLDGRNVVFGRLVKGDKDFAALQDVYTSRGKPLSDVVIEDCGLAQ